MIDGQCAIRTDNTIHCWGPISDAPDGQYTAISAGVAHSCAIRSDNTVACWGEDLAAEVTAVASMEAIAIPSGETVTCDAGWPVGGLDPTFTCDDDDVTKDTTDEDSFFDPAAAARCFAVHKFGAQPVDVAKTADHSAVLAQVRWGYHDAIGCFLRLDEASTNTLRTSHG